MVIFVGGIHYIALVVLSPLLKTDGAKRGKAGAPTFSNGEQENHIENVNTIPQTKKPFHRYKTAGNAVVSHSLWRLPQEHEALKNLTLKFTFFSEPRHTERFIQFALTPVWVAEIHFQLACTSVGWTDEINESKLRKLADTSAPQLLHWGTKRELMKSHPLTERFKVSL